MSTTMYVFVKKYEKYHYFLAKKKNPKKTLSEAMDVSNLCHAE